MQTLARVNRTFREKQDVLKQVNEEIGRTIDSFEKRLTAVKRPA